MGFSTYTQEFPRPARLGRTRSEATIEVEEALTESARSGKPVMFDWVVDRKEMDREKARVRNIAFRLGFNCSLADADGKIILKASLRDGKTKDGKEHEAALLVREAEKMAETQAEAEEQLRTAADMIHNRQSPVTNPIFQKPIEETEQPTAPPRKTARKAKP